jgi:hypothetical protein
MDRSILLRGGSEQANRPKPEKNIIKIRGLAITNKNAIHNYFQKNKKQKKNRWL